MKIIRVIWLATGILSTSFAYGEQCEVSQKTEKGYQVSIDGEKMFAMPLDKIKDLMDKVGNLQEMTNKLENLKTAQAEKIQLQEAQIKRMEAQLADYDTLSKKYKALLSQAPVFSLSVGAGIVNTFDDTKAMGSIGVKYDSWALQGLFYSESKGLLLSKEFDLF